MVPMTSPSPTTKPRLENRTPTVTLALANARHQGAFCLLIHFPGFAAGPITNRFANPSSPVFLRVKARLATFVISFALVSATLCVSSVRFVILDAWNYPLRVISERFSGALILTTLPGNPLK